MADEVTVVISSYDRVDLMENCLKTLLQFNSYPIKKIIIVEDSQKTEVFAEILKIVDRMNIPNCEVIYNQDNLGVVGTYDKLMRLADTEFIFRIEEDYYFINPDFIEKSIDIMNSDPNILQVHIREERFFPHPVYQDIKTTPKGTQYKELHKNVTGCWDGFSFNTGLRRKSHYNLLMEYHKFATEEAAINVAYRQWPELHSVILVDNPEGYTVHTPNRSAVFRGLGNERSW